MSLFSPGLSEVKQQLGSLLDQLSVDEHPSYDIKAGAGALIVPGIGGFPHYESLGTNLHNICEREINSGRLERNSKQVPLITRDKDKYNNEVTISVQIPPGFLSAISDDAANECLQLVHEYVQEEVKYEDLLDEMQNLTEYPAAYVSVWIKGKRTIFLAQSLGQEMDSKGDRLSVLYAYINIKISDPIFYQESSSAIPRLLITPEVFMNLSKEKIQVFVDAVEDPRGFQQNFTWQEKLKAMEKVNSRYFDINNRTHGLN